MPYFGMPPSMGTHTPILVFCFHACMNYRADIFSNLDIGACAYRDINIPFESTENKQQYDKITCNEVRNVFW